MDLGLYVKLELDYGILNLGLIELIYLFLLYLSLVDYNCILVINLEILG